MKIQVRDLNFQPILKYEKGILRATIWKNGKEYGFYGSLLNFDEEKELAAKGYLYDTWQLLNTQTD